MADLGTLVLGTFTNVNDTVLQLVVSSAAKCGHILFAAGTRCQDNSNLEAHQAGTT